MYIWFWEHRGDCLKINCCQMIVSFWIRRIYLKHYVKCYYSAIIWKKKKKQKPFHLHYNEVFTLKDWDKVSSTLQNWAHNLWHNNKHPCVTTYCNLYFWRLPIFFTSVFPLAFCKLKPSLLPFRELNQVTFYVQAWLLVSLSLVSPLKMYTFKMAMW